MAEGEYPKCAGICPVQRKMDELVESCLACPLRSKKAANLKPPTFADFFGEAVQKGDG